MLNYDQIAALLTPKKAQSKGRALVRTESGTKWVPLSEVDVGSFQGKQGTLRRSNKGRQYRAPNGRRYFEQEYYSQSEVITYQT